MRKTCLLLLIALTVASCDLLFNRDSDSTPANNDISVSVNISPSVKQGEPVAAEVTVKNIGNVSLQEQIEITLTDQTEGEVIGSSTVEEGLAPGDSVNLNYNWETTGSEIGEHNIVATHNLEDDNPANNSSTSVLMINDPDVTDLSVTSINLPDMVNQREIVDVEVMVKNTGNQDVSEEVPVTLTDDTDGVEIGTQSFSDGIAAGDSAALIFSWNTEGASLGEHTLSAVQTFSDENSANDSRTQTVTMNEALIVDVAITVFDVPDEANRGDEVDVSVTVENIGNKAAEEDFDITLTDETDGIEIEKETVSRLASGDQVVLNFTWDTEDASIGEHTLTVAHNLDDEEAGNNSRSTEVTINIPPFIDIAVTEVNAPGNAVSGQVVEIEVNLRNQGNRNVDEDFTVTLVNRTSDTEIDTQTVEGGLQEGEATSLKFQWNTSGLSQGFYTIAATSNYEDDNEDNDTESDRIFIFN